MYLHKSDYEIGKFGKELKNDPQIKLGFLSPKHFVLIMDAQSPDYRN
jgi:hypothetical protein